MIASEAAATRSAVDVCRQALGGERFAAAYAALASFPAAPKTPQEWFDFCADFSYEAGHHDLLKALKAKAPGAPIEVFVGLNALIIAADRIAEFPLTISVRRNFETMCGEWAAMEPHWADHFDVDSPRFVDIVRLASLKRFLAGEVGFEFGSRLPYNFMFRCHPIQLPGLLAQVFGPMRGAAPLLPLHFNYARRNRLVLSQLEFERGLWRMAKMLEANPTLKGISSNSWFHSAAVRESFPRLAWMRDTFLEGGAYAIDLEAGHADDIGYNSSKRKELHESGQFLPRHTLLLWPRDSALTWAASRPDLADPDEAPITAPQGPIRKSLTPPRPMASLRANSPLQLWDGLAWRRRFGSKYFAALLAGPGLVLGAAAGFAFGWLLALPVFILTALAMLVAQYYFSQ